MFTVVIQKDPGIAAILSFFCKGLGQIYNGQIAKGLLLMCIQVVNVLLCFALIGLVMFPLLWLYGIWDAYDTAKRTHIVSEVV